MDEEAVRSKMQQALSVVTGDIGVIRTGRATPSLVEGLDLFLYAGTQKLKLQEVATITSPDPQTLLVEPWDKSIIAEIAKGILAANVGMNPMVDGEIIRISMPPLTTEDREKYVKLLSTKLESGRIMIRQIRGDEQHQIKKKFESKEISEDEKFNFEKELQALTDGFIAKIDEAGERKKQELLSV